MLILVHKTLIIPHQTVLNEISLSIASFVQQVHERFQDIFSFFCFPEAKRKDTPYVIYRRDSTPCNYTE